MVHWPVEFTQDYLFPSPRARYTVSFGIDDVLLTAASDSEDFGPSLADALPLSGQEARPSPAYSELVDVLSRAVEKLSHGLDDEPRDSRSLKHDDRFLSGVNPKMSGGSCRFSVICIRRFPDPGNSLFLPALLTRRPLYRHAVCAIHRSLWPAQISKLYVWGLRMRFLWFKM